MISTVYEPNSFVPMLRIDTTREVIQGQPQAKKALYFFHTNHLGTPEALIDQHSGQIVWQAEFDPWGNTKAEHDPLHLGQNIRMQGQQLDVETGLFYNRFRYYDPGSGRYVSQDPIGLAGGMNLYGYVDAAPLVFVDPLGLDVTSVMADRAAGIPHSGSVLETLRTPPRADGNPLGWGCGDSKTDNFVPDKPLGNNFFPACRAHDQCYGDKNGPSKATCDSNFKNNMLKACRDLKWPKKQVCEGLAKDYYKAVDLLGNDAFKNGRN